MLRRRVHALGVMGLDGPLGRLGVVVAPAGRYRDALEEMPAGVVIVLGDLALGVLHPESVAEAAIRKDWEVLILPLLLPPGAAARWTRLREFTRVPSVASLPAAMKLARRAAPRMTVPPEEWAAEWIRSCACGRCHGYLRVAQRLRRFTRKAWAMRLGVKEGDLRSHFGECLGVTPTEILRRLQRCVLQWGREGRSRNQEERAALLGLAGPRCLRRVEQSAAVTDARPPSDVDNSTHLSPCTPLTAHSRRNTIPPPHRDPTEGPGSVEVGDGQADAGNRGRRETG